MAKRTIVRLFSYREYVECLDRRETGVVFRFALKPVLDGRSDKVYHDASVSYHGAQQSSAPI